jgi:hypothetical protein
MAPLKITLIIKRGCHSAKHQPLQQGTAEAGQLATSTPFHLKGQHM